MKSKLSGYNGNVVTSGSGLTIGISDTPVITGNVTWNATDLIIKMSKKDGCLGKRGWFRGSLRMAMEPYRGPYMKNGWYSMQGMTISGNGYSSIDGKTFVDFCTEMKEWKLLDLVGGLQNLNHPGLFDYLVFENSNREVLLFNKIRNDLYSLILSCGLKNICIVEGDVGRGAGIWYVGYGIELPGKIELFYYNSRIGKIGSVKFIHSVSPMDDLYFQWEWTIRRLLKTGDKMYGPTAE